MCKYTQFMLLTTRQRRSKPADSIIPYKDIVRRKNGLHFCGRNSNYIEIKFITRVHKFSYPMARLAFLSTRIHYG